MPTVLLDVEVNWHCRTAVGSSYLGLLGFTNL